MFSTMLDFSSNHFDWWLMPARTYSQLRKWGANVLDIEHNRAILNTGCMGTLYGANIYVTPSLHMWEVRGVCSESVVSFQMLGDKNRLVAMLWTIRE